MEQEEIEKLKKKQKTTNFEEITFLEGVLLEECPKNPRLLNNNSYF